MQQKTYYDVISAAQRLVGKSVALREPLPLGSANAAVANFNTRQRSIESLNDLIGVVSGSDLEWNLHKEAHVDMHESPVPMVRQYECIREFSETTTVVRRSDMLFAFDEGPDKLTIRLRDRSMAFPTTHSHLVYSAMSGSEVSAKLLAKSPQEVGPTSQILKALLREGVLVPA